MKQEGGRGELLSLPPLYITQIPDGLVLSGGRYHNSIHYYQLCSVTDVKIMKVLVLSHKTSVNLLVLFCTK